MFIEFYNYDHKYEFVRADQIESIVKAGNGVHDFGAVVLLGGRRIAFGQSGEAERMLKVLYASDKS